MFRSLMTIIRELYLYLTEVIFMLKRSVNLRRYILRGDVAVCHTAAVRHTAASPNIYNEVILPSGLT